MNEENVSKFRKWWRLINIEHLIVFWLTGAFSICLLALLSFATTNGNAPSAGINFVLHEASAIASVTFPFLGSVFLVLTGLMLFSTQLTVLDATSRIVSENLLILKSDKWSSKSLPKIYYSFLWAQIVAGIIIFLFGLTEPLTLLIIEAVINAFAMFIHIGAVTLLNITSLEKEIRPSIARIFMMGLAFSFFGYFTIRTILNYL